jgi:Holliday junction resolvase RusA-like endonuclease
VYEKLLLYSLPPSKKNWDKIPIELHLRIGFSNVASDIDNAVKPFIDILQKRYNFNDKYIFRLVIEKEIVTKGKEFIEYTIKKLEDA